VLCEEGMGEADVVIAGYSWRVRVHFGVFVRALVFVCVCVCVCACVCLHFVQVFICLCLYVYKPPRGPPRCMQRADHHRLFQSTCRRRILGGGACGGSQPCVRAQARSPPCV
jgi:hypothetical protein